MGMGAERTGVLIAEIRYGVSDFYFASAVRRRTVLVLVLARQKCTTLLATDGWRSVAATDTNKYVRA